MTYDELREAIEKMTPEQRRTVVAVEANYDDAVEIGLVSTHYSSPGHHHRQDHPTLVPVVQLLTQ